MKIFLLFTLLFMAIPQGQSGGVAPAISSEGLPVTVLSIKWFKDRQTTEESSSNSPAAAMIPQNKNPSQLVWGEIGPKLMARAVRKFSLKKFKKDSRFFCPVNYEEWQTVLQAHARLPLDDRSFAIHLWNEMWRLAGQDKNARYHERCLYEKLKRTYLPAAGSVPYP